MLSAELKAFYRVAQLGSITQAAKKLGLSQPTVTTQIRNLESHYAVELFYRGGRRLTLSDGCTLDWSTKASGTDRVRAVSAFIF